MKNEIRMTLIVAALRRYMAQRGFTQEDLAQVTGVNQSQLSRILAGKCKTISKSMQLVLAKTGVSPAVVAPDRPSITEHPRLLAAVTAAWDGTPRGGDLLAKLIDAAVEFQREQKP